MKLRAISYRYDLGPYDLSRLALGQTVHDLGSVYLQSDWAIGFHGRDDCDLDSDLGLDLSDCDLDSDLGLGLDLSDCDLAVVFWGRLS